MAGPACGRVGRRGVHGVTEAELIKRLRGWDHCWPASWLEHAVVQAADIIECLAAERERLALAICGGEDAPGYANAQTVETLERVAKQNQQSHGATINSLLAAEAERDSAFRQRDVAVAFGTWCLDKMAALELERDRLREDVEELDFLRHEGGPDSVAAMEAELKRLRAVLSDIKTASVCSVSRNVAASALGEAAA